MTLDIHPFEKANLGNAPFRFVGVFEKVYQACPGAPEQAAGTCDYCGNGIRYCFQIMSADGKMFVVGCECVKKTDKASLINATEFDRAVAAKKRELNKARRDKVVARENERIEAAMKLLDHPEVEAAIRALPHPSSYRAKETYFDYIQFCLKMAGHSGLLTIARKIEQITKEIK